MDISFLLQTLGSITPLSNEFQNRLENQTIEETFKRKEFVLHVGDVCRRIYFIKKGFIRAYYIDKNGKECTSWLMGSGDIMISVYSYFMQKPTHECIEVLEDSLLQSISWEQMQAVYADVKEGNLLGRVITERYYIHAEERMILLRTTSAEERYEMILQKYPDIEQKTTQGQLASYLDISRETLCRLKARNLRAEQNKIL